jgi:hypothetical protein
MSDKLMLQIYELVGKPEWFMRDGALQSRHWVDNTFIELWIFF